MGTGQQPISLHRIHQALQTMLATLTPSSAVKQVIGAVGLSQGSLTAALAQLEGVILNCPATWSDTYCFNLREAVLKAELVGNPNKLSLLMKQRPPC